MKFQVGDDFSKILFGDDSSREIVPKQFGDDFSWGRFHQGTIFPSKNRGGRGKGGGGGGKF